MKSKGIKCAAAILTALTVVPVSSWAFGGHQGEGRKGPPQAAIEACKDKTEGAEVEFTNRRGETIKATCKEVAGQLVAVPERGFRGSKGTPPGETQGGQ